MRAFGVRLLFVLRSCASCVAFVLCWFVRVRRQIAWWLTGGSQRRRIVEVKHQMLKEYVYATILQRQYIMKMMDIAIIVRMANIGMAISVVLVSQAIIVKMMN